MINPVNTTKSLLIQILLPPCDPAVLQATDLAADVGHNIVCQTDCLLQFFIVSKVCSSCSFRCSYHDMV